MPRVIWLKQKSCHASLLLKVLFWSSLDPNDFPTLSYPICPHTQLAHCALATVATLLAWSMSPGDLHSPIFALLFPVPGNPLLFLPLAKPYPQVFAQILREVLLNHPLYNCITFYLFIFSALQLNFFSHMLTSQQFCVSCSLVFPSAWNST